MQSGTLRYGGSGFASKLNFTGVRVPVLSEIKERIRGLKIRVRIALAPGAFFYVRELLL